MEERWFLSSVGDTVPRNLEVTLAIVYHDPFKPKVVESSRKAPRNRLSQFSGGGPLNYSATPASIGMYSTLIPRGQFYWQMCKRQSNATPLRRLKEKDRKTCLTWNSCDEAVAFSQAGWLPCPVSHVFSGQIQDDCSSSSGGVSPA